MNNSESSSSYHRSHHRHHHHHHSRSFLNKKREREIKKEHYMVNKSSDDGDNENDDFFGTEERIIKHMKTPLKKLNIPDSLLTEEFDDEQFNQLVWDQNKNQMNWKAERREINEFLISKDANYKNILRNIYNNVNQVKKGGMINNRKEIVNTLKNENAETLKIGIFYFWTLYNKIIDYAKTHDNRICTKEDEWNITALDKF